jgi:NADPH:quinone reductase-like Zn-dependent oxidoreductase
MRPGCNPVRHLGADRVIDYTSEDFASGIEAYDLIFDTVGNHSFRQLRRVLAPTGVVIPIGEVGVTVMVGGMIRSLFTRQNDVRLLSRPNREGLLSLAGLVEAGTLTTVIDRTYRLDETPEAMTYVARRHAKGKVVILVTPDAERAQCSGPEHSSRTAR